MRRRRPHHHPCQSCGAETECYGEYERNYDGFPDVICVDFHLPYGTINARFVCEQCAEKDGK